MQAAMETPTPPTLRRGPGRPRTGQAPRSTRHVKLDLPTDTALQEMSKRTRLPINRLLRIAVRSLLRQGDSAIFGGPKNTAEQKPS